VTSRGKRTSCHSLHCFRNIVQIQEKGQSSTTIQRIDKRITMSFFGFDAVLPERRGGNGQGAAEEDIAVYTWGQEGFDDLGGQLMEGGDEAND
jgi:hypothetical protein